MKLFVISAALVATASAGGAPPAPPAPAAGCPPGQASESGEPADEEWCQAVKCAPIYVLSGHCKGEVGDYTPPTQGPTEGPTPKAALPPGAWCESTADNVSHEWCMANKCADHLVEAKLCALTGIAPPSTEAPWVAPVTEAPVPLGPVPVGFTCKSVVNHISHEYCEANKCAGHLVGLCANVDGSDLASTAPWEPVTYPPFNGQGPAPGPNEPCGAAPDAKVTHQWCKDVKCAAVFVSEGLCEYINGASAAPTVPIVTTESPTTAAPVPCPVENDCCSTVAFASHEWCNDTVGCADAYTAAGICLRKDGFVPTTTEGPSTAAPAPFARGEPAAGATCISAALHIPHSWCVGKCEYDSPYIGDICECVGDCPTAPPTTTTTAEATTAEPTTAGPAPARR